MIHKKTNKYLWYPPNYTDRKLSEWNAMKLGIMISYDMATYTASESYTVNRYILPPVKATFAPPSDIVKKCSKWITDLESLNEIDFYTIVTSHQHGHMIYDSKVVLGDGIIQRVADASLGTINLPYYTDYCYTDNDIVKVMVDTVKGYGKKVFLYYNIGRRINERGSDNYGNSRIYQKCTFDRVNELYSLYKPDGFWFDATGESPWDDPQIGYPLHQLYTKIKNINPDLFIITHLSNGTEMYSANNLKRFPGDAFSGEIEFEKLTYGDEYQLQKRHYNKTYYIGNEILSRGATYYFGSQDKGGVAYSQATVQSYYDHARAASSPYCINMSPNQNGIIDETQYALVKNLVL